MSELWWPEEIQVSTMRADSQSNTDKPAPRLHQHLFLTGNLDYNDGQDHGFEKVHDLVFFDKEIFVPNTEQKEVIFLSTLVEFGCESLLPHYYLPYFANKNKDYHTIAVGWPGRSILYEHQVNEFWSLDPKYGHLRAYTKAFTGMSKNIAAIETALSKFGHVVKSKNLNKFFCEGVCKACRASFINVKKIQNCEKCGSADIINSILADTDYHKLRYKHLYFDFGRYIPLLKQATKEKNIAIFARNRATYGRNLPIEFYKRFCKKLSKKGYHILWLGEKVSTLPCFDKSFFDFQKSEYADDVHACFALVSQCKATFQAWTASTRFAQALNIPYCLVESFDQIFGNGQEGKRINLLTRDMTRKKIIISNFNTAIKDIKYFADLCYDNFIEFIEEKNYTDIVGAVESKEYFGNLFKEYDLWKLI